MFKIQVPPHPTPPHSALPLLSFSPTLLGPTHPPHPIPCCRQRVHVIPHHDAPWLQVFSSDVEVVAVDPSGPRCMTPASPRLLPVWRAGLDDHMASARQSQRLHDRHLGLAPVAISAVQPDDVELRPDVVAGEQHAQLGPAVGSELTVEQEEREEAGEEGAAGQ